jgi:hypothetical protein
VWHTRAVFPSEIAAYFWDVDVASIDVEKHKDYVIERLMSRGDLHAMAWLRARFDLSDLRSFLLRRGHRALAPRELSYWALICDVEMDSRTGGGRPAWAG